MVGDGSGQRRHLLIMNEHLQLVRRDQKEHRKEVTGWPALRAMRGAHFLEGKLWRERCEWEGKWFLPPLPLPPPHPLNKEHIYLYLFVPSPGRTGIIHLGNLS